MSMSTATRTVFDRSLKLTRWPFDAALGLFGASDSAAKHAVDRLEAGARSATGTLFGDEQLKEEGHRVSQATEQREYAAQLREEAEEERRQADKRRRERESRAAKTAATRKQKAAKSAAKAEQVKAKRDRTAQLDKLDAKEEAIKSKEDASRLERQVKKVEEVAAAAKRDRKDGNG
jgi:hypothetical protein